MIRSIGRINIEIPKPIATIDAKGLNIFNESSYRWSIISVFPFNKTHDSVQFDENTQNSTILCTKINTFIFVFWKKPIIPYDFCVCSGFSSSPLNANPIIPLLIVDQ